MICMAQAGLQPATSCSESRLSTTSECTVALDLLCLNPKAQTIRKKRLHLLTFLVSNDQQFEGQAFSHIISLSFNGVLLHVDKKEG